MIEKIELKNFKCHKKLSINLKMLNIFSGLNSAGKSTVIQSILLYKQSEKSISEKFWINGEYVSLGTGEDILLNGAEEDIIGINFIDSSNKGNNYELVYKSSDDYLNINIQNYNHDSTHYICTAPFEYLNAERISPKSTYDNNSSQIQENHLGIHGEYTAHYLSNALEIALKSPWYNSNSLEDAIVEWIQHISPNISYQSKSIEKTELSQLIYSVASKPHRPVNIGFGVTYVLPVIVALLKAKPGSILIVENPEAHLHPKGQRKIGELIAQCANAGVQVFIETHSDHVMNGIRIATKQQQINYDDVGLFHFYIDEGKHKYETIKIDENGKLDHWPEGFFDEWNIAMGEILL